jgi:hypothetical protein
MLQTIRKPLLVVVVLLCTVGGSLTAYGVFRVTSNVVQVDIVNADMQYTVVLSASVSDSVVSLTAVVRDNGMPIGAGIAVVFYCSVNGGDWTYFATELTNPGGVAHATYTATANGAYDFKAIAISP